ncbi:capsid [Bat circovirus POA/2012/V]|uniref:Capsid n=1 Tax=Bat circovirus POA/2012/V TaxID=1572238 RepID=A0A0A0YN52_9VIRU|nr:capsid [Bat circovirus POA/2012/V]
MVRRYRGARTFIRRRRFLRKPRRYRRKHRRGTNDGVRYFKLRRTIEITDLATGNDFSDNPSTASDWASISTLFTHYRVKAMSIRYVPRFNVNQFQSTNNGFRPLAITHDVNSTTGNLSFNAMIARENTRILDASKPFTYYRKMRGIQTQVQTLHPGPWYRTAQPISTQRFFAQTDSPNTINILGGGVLTFYIAAKNRM